MTTVYDYLNSALNTTRRIHIGSSDDIICMQAEAVSLEIMEAMILLGYPADQNKPNSQADSLKNGLD